MITEDEKRVGLVSYYSFSNTSLAEMCRGSLELADWAHAAVDFVRYIPSPYLPELQEYKDTKMFKAAQWYKNSNLGDSDAIAFIIATGGFSKWVNADLARIVSRLVEPHILQLFYYNTYLVRRKRWGMFG